MILVLNSHTTAYFVSNSEVSGWVLNVCVYGEGWGTTINIQIASPLQDEYKIKV